MQAHIWPSQPKAALFIEGPGTRGARHPASTSPAELTVPLSAVAGSGQEMVAAAALLAIDILADYGVEELDLITFAGQINQYAAYSDARRHVETWATARGVPSTK